MISGEDESSSVLNGRLRPRKSTANILNPPNKPNYKLENKVAQDKPKRNSTPSKASPNKQDDLTAKADSLHPAQLLCPYCDRKFTSKLSASKHARRIHLSKSKQDNFIKCLYCNHSEAVASNIIRHMVDSHPNQYFACLECNTRFLYTSELAEHNLNVCEKQKQAYRSKLRQKTSTVSKKDQKKIDVDDKIQYSGENMEPKHEPEFNGVVISCELKPSHGSDAVDIEDNITTNLILPSNMGTVLDKNAVIILDDIQWKKRIPPNFSFRNVDADQILSRLGVVHRSPRVGESTRREWLKMIDVSNQKFEKCFDTNFYSRVASNVQQNLSKFLDGSFNFSPDPDKVIKTRKTKSSAIINTAEGFPILLPHEQYSRNRFDGYIPRAIAPKHKWKWDSTENDKNIIIDANVMKRDNHVDNCIITLVSSLDMWTQLRMRRKFEEFFCKAETERAERQNIIGRELKEILESRELPNKSSQVVEYTGIVAAPATTFDAKNDVDFPSFLGLSARDRRSEEVVQPAVLSGEWVRPRCYVCCACGDQTYDARSLTAHMAAHHINAQVQHYEIVGESLLNADILKHLYVPPSQMPNRTRPLRGFRDCTKCKKSITLEDLHQHMLDCAGDTPTVRRKCRSRPFGVRRRRPRLPDNSMRKKIRKDLRARHNPKALLRTRPRIRTEVGDAETIRKMIADLPAKRHRQAAGNLSTQQVLRPRRKLDQQRNTFKIKRLTSKDCLARKVQIKKDKDLVVLDEDDQPLKPRTKSEPEKVIPAKKRVSSRVAASKNKIKKSVAKEDRTGFYLEQNILSDTASTSQPHQLSGENSAQRLNTTTRGKDSKAEEQGSNGDHKNTPDEEVDKNIHKSIAPDPTLLKHSINNITASNNTSQEEQQYSLPQKESNTTLNDRQNIFLENEVASSLPEKPPLQTNQKRSSQKKRESLLNCIEKIKNHQKGETMMNYQNEVDKATERQRRLEQAHLALMDPHPAIISRTHDEFGTAKNVVPDTIIGPQNVAGGLNLERDYRWGSQGGGAQVQHGVPIMAPIIEPNCVYKQTELNAFKAKVSSGGKRRKSPSTRLLVPYNEQVNQLAQAYYPQHYNYMAYSSMLQAHVQKQLEQSQVMPEIMLMQHQTSDTYKSSLLAQYKNQNYLAPVQYSIYNTDFNYDVGMDQIRLCNEAGPPAITKTQQNSNISYSPQQWLKESVQPNQTIDNYSLPGMLSMVPGNEFVPPFNPRTSQKRVSESSESDACSTSRIMDNTDTLYNATMRTMSTESTNALAIQRIRESSDYHNDVLRTKETRLSDTNYDSPIYIQDGYESVSRSHDNRSSYSDSTFKAEPKKKQRTGNNKHYMAQVGDHPFKSQYVQKSDDSHVHGMPECIRYSNLNNKILHDRYVVEHPRSLSPFKNQVAIITHSGNQSTIRKSIDFDTSDQINDLSLRTNRAMYGQTHNSFKELVIDHETSNNHTDSGLTDEPLDLSIKHTLDICDDNIESKAFTENNQKQSRTLCQAKTTREKSSKNAYKKNIESCEQILEVDATKQYISDYENGSESVTMLPNELNNQHVPCAIDKNYAVENTIQSSCEQSAVVYCKETKKVKEINQMDSTKVPITRQYSNEKENSGLKYPNEPIFSSNLNENDQYTSGSNILESVSTNSNYSLETRDNSLDSKEKTNENRPSKEKQRWFEMTETAVISKNNSSCYDSKAIQETNQELGENTGNFELEQKIVQDKLISSESTNMNSEETSADKTTEIAIASSVDKDRIACLPRQMHAKLVQVSLSNTKSKIRRVLIKIGAPENAYKYKTLVDLITFIGFPNLQSFLVSFYKCLMNTRRNRARTNTAGFPSSSSFPKNRYHSASTNSTNSDESETLHSQSYFNNIIEGELFTESEARLIRNIIELTSDDLTNFENIIIIIIEETAYKLKLLKFSNQKTSSLRAVRIKSSLERMSTTNDKQIEVFNHQPIYVESQKNITKVFDSKYGYGILLNNNASDQISGYNASYFIHQPETKATVQDVVLWETPDTSAVSLLDNNKHDRQLKFTSDAGAGNQLTYGNDELRGTNLPLTKKHKSDNDTNELNTKAVIKVIEHDEYSVSNKTNIHAVRGQSLKTCIDKSDSSTILTDDGRSNCIPETSNFICPEELKNNVENDILNETNYIDTQVTRKNIVCMENNDIISLEQNLTENMTPKRSSVVDEGFDDDDSISQAYIAHPNTEEETNPEHNNELLTAETAPLHYINTVSEDKLVINELRIYEARNNNENNVDVVKNKFKENYDRSACPRNTTNDLLDHSQSMNTKTKLKSKKKKKSKESNSAIKESNSAIKTSQRVHSILLADSDISANLDIKSERTLRRRRRRTSMYTDDKEIKANNHEPNADAIIPVGNKLPITKKQLIFSKLLLDDNLEKEQDNITDTSTEAIILPAKRKRKKIKNASVHCKSTETDSLNLTSVNNIKPIQKEVSALNKQNHPETNYGTIQNKNLNEEKANTSLDKRKLDVSLSEDRKDSIKPKRTKTTYQKNIILKQQDEDNLLIQTDTKINLNNIAKVSELCQVKSNEMADDSQMAIPLNNNGFKKQTEKNSGCVEMKTACYNRPIFKKQLICLDPVKNPENYDPYDINFDMDITETTRPIANRRTSKSQAGSSKISKKCLNFDSTNNKSRNKTEMRKPMIAEVEIIPPNVSDSDSSVSDVPLQKYVEAKEKLPNEGLKSPNCNISESTLLDEIEGQIVLPEMDTPSAKNASTNKNEELDEYGAIITLSTLPTISRANITDATITTDTQDTTVNTTNTHQDVNQIKSTIEFTEAKSKNTKKHNYRSSNSKTFPNISGETKPKSITDTYMENFGIFSVRQPRRSNLLASKKISETFSSMIESDDTYFRSKDRQRKSSHSENRKSVDGNSKVLPETNNPNSDGNNSISLAQQTTANGSLTATPSSTMTIPSIAQQEALASKTVDEPCSGNYDGEVDLITAQRMLESEEIRKLERDLYSGFKEAAEANAGRTSGFNQLRVEDTVPHVTTNHTVSSTNNEIKLESNKKPAKSDFTAKFKAPETSETARISDSSEELEDKPLMYPESKVNMFEDKYDIIKRRREERERAKQAELAKKAELAETPKTSKIEKSKKKPDRKYNRKKSKKPTFQASQVPTKGALKGFDGIISISTQDLNMPRIDVSPSDSRQRQGRSKKTNECVLKARTNSVSSYKSDSDVELKKISSTPDVYEFQDEERPVTKGYRLTKVMDKIRSSSSEGESRAVSVNKAEKNKNKRKHSDDDDDFVYNEDHKNNSHKIKRWKGKGKEKGKRKGRGKGKHSSSTKHSDSPIKNLGIHPKERANTDFDIDKISGESKQRMKNQKKMRESAEEDDNRLSNDYTLRSLQVRGETFDDSDVDDQIIIPGTSGFVPDRNDESSYESDMSSPTPVLKGPIACTCQIITDSDDSEIERGCSHKLCRYKISEAKNAVMGKIFKNNAVRYEKPVSPKLEPKPDMNKLFDSLLFSDTTETSTTANPGLLSAATQSNTNSFEKNISIVDDGFSSPNHRDHVTKNDYFTHGSGEFIKTPNDNVSQKHFQIKASKSAAIKAMKEKDVVEQSNNNQTFKLPKESIKIKHDNKIKASKSYEALVFDKMSESGNLYKFKHSHRGRKHRGSHSHRSARRSDIEISSCEDDLSVAKLRRKKRRASKKHKSHHKRHRESEDEESIKRHGDSNNILSSIRNSPTFSAIDNEEVELESKQKHTEKISLYRKSDEGISTSHDNSADAYDLAPPAENEEAPVQRARRKCTVGKQNVLVEHWSSSESEAEVRKTSVKKSGRPAKKERAVRPSREFEIEDSEDESSGRAPPPKVRARAAVAAARDDASDNERDINDKKEQELHGWIVGRSHKKLMAMLVCSKSKSRCDDKYKDEDEDHKEADEKKK